MAEETILLVESDPDQRAIYSRRLEKVGFHVVARETGEAAAKDLPEDVAAVVTEVSLPGMDGGALMERLHQARPGLPVIMLTSEGNVDEAFALLDRGAFDYVQKTESFRDFTLRVSRAVRHGGLEREVGHLRQELALRSQIVPSSASTMLEALERADAVAQTGYPVLLLGESGTGKELVARRIHRHSDRRGGPFLTVNCGAIPSELFESQLFGHRKGSFTGAGRDQAGLFQEADGGTLLLDEIGETGLEHQVKLLRVLQEGEIRRVGDTDSTRVDVRIISATNQDLAGAVKEGAFREDLYYRLNVMPIRLPPLRERREDILPLARHFLKTALAETGKQIDGFSPEAIAALQSFDWPGNIRQLRNRVRQSVIVCADGSIRPEDLALGEGLTAEPGSTDALLAQPLADARRAFERIYLEGLLRAHDGNVTRAARSAGKHRSEIYTLLRRHSIRPGEFRR